MDVGTMANLTTNVGKLTNAYGTQNVSKAKEATTSAAAAATDSTKGFESDAYKVDISEAAKSHGEAVKGLTDDQIKALKSDIDKSHQLMIRTLTEQNTKLQAWLDQGVGKLNFGGIKIDASRFALPAVGTTPEEAAAAIADGGPYSVDAVATRIFDLASAIAGGDPEKLKKMQAAVEKGFEQAGMTWNKATGQDTMPQITKDTHAEITKRFDNLYAKLTGKVNTEQAQVAMNPNPQM